MIGPTPLSPSHLLDLIIGICHPEQAHVHHPWLPAVGDSEAFGESP
jgi:hypothetical protein